MTMPRTLQRLNDLESNVDTQASALAAHDAALTAQENTLTAQAGEIVGLTTSTNKHESDLAAQASALAAVEDGLGALAGKVSSAFLAGGIVMFSGTFGGTDGKRPIPVGATDADEGWALCDGSNGTPDLRGRFIVGAGGSYAQGATGGAASASVSGSVSGTTGATTLTVAQMPKHRHSSPEGLSSGSGSYTFSSNDRSDYTSSVTAYAGASNSHTHTMAGSLSATVNTLPPYYALAYIMKLPTA